VIVTDDFTNRGLGLLITDYCMQIAGEWGVKHVHAVTQRENRPMLALLRDYQFELSNDLAEGLVHAERQLRPV